MHLPLGSILTLRSTVTLELAVHVISAYIGALIAFPLAISARKGSNWHRISGRLFVGCFVLICLTGFLLNWDELRSLPVFRSWGAPGGAAGFYQPDESEALHQLVVLGTGSINTFALYLAVSGWRVWARQKAIATKSSQLVDQLLAILEIVACAISIYAFWELIPAVGKNLLLRIPMIALVAVAFADALNDLIQTSTARAPERWWLLHARKLIMAELGLVAAVALRCTPSSYVLASMALSVVIVAIPAVLLIRRQMHEG